MRLRFWHDAYATHQPVLLAAARVCQGPMVEFGCGDGSTPLLHEIARQRGLALISIDGDPSWLNRYRWLEGEGHSFRLVEDWDEELGRSEWDEPWGLVFVDQHPWEARAATVDRLGDSAEFVVVHDCNYFPSAGLFGRSIREIVGPSDVGERDYGDVFRSWREFFPLSPWPHHASGPPTLLGSNRRDCAQIDVDYLGSLPWRRRLERMLQPSPGSR